MVTRKLWLIVGVAITITSLDATNRGCGRVRFKNTLPNIYEEADLQQQAAAELEHKKRLGAEDLNRRTIESQKRVQQKSTKTRTQPKERVITRESERHDSEQQLEYEEYKRERARRAQLEWERYELGRQQAQEQQEAQENEDLYQLSI